MTKASIPPAPPTNTPGEGEISRFRTLVRRHINSPAKDRSHLRDVLVEYIRFSEYSDTLIDSLIMACIAMRSADRSEIAIDVLAKVGPKIQDYTWQYLQHDIQQFNRMHPNVEFRPNDDYWHILLRATARCGHREKLSCQILSGCQDAKSRGVAESVVEALADLGTDEAKAVLRHMNSTHHDQFIRDLAAEVLEDF